MGHISDDQDEVKNKNQTLKYSKEVSVEKKLFGKCVLDHPT